MAEMMQGDCRNLVEIVEPILATLLSYETSGGKTNHTPFQEMSGLTRFDAVTARVSSEH
jgi:hypothetical protein